MTPTPPTATSPSRRRRWPRVLLVLWLIALAASHVVWRQEERAPRLRPGDVSARVQAVVGEELGAEEVLFAYRDLGADAASARATLVLLHGSPGSLQDFDALAALLATMGSA